MKFPSSTVFALLGAALIAISYGLARFACHALERSAPPPPRYIEHEPEEEVEDETGLQAAYDYQLQNEDGEPYKLVANDAENR